MGKQARFEAVVTGLPQPDVIWLKDDKPVEQSDRVVIERKGNTNILSIKKSEAGDIGAYKIQATNEAGEDSCLASLSVKGELITEAEIIFTEKLFCTVH